MTLTINVPEYGPVKLDATIPEGLKAGETFQVGASVSTSVSVLVSVSMCLCQWVCAKERAHACAWF